MNLKHILVDTDIDDFVVLHNPEQKYLLREYIYPSEGHLQLMQMYYDGVSGCVWTPITLDCLSNDTKFMIGLNTHLNSFDEWQDGKVYLIPHDNIEIYHIKTEVTFENDQRIKDWSVNCEKWWLAWHKSAIQTTLQEYIDGQN